MESIIKFALPFPAVFFFSLIGHSQEKSGTPSAFFKLYDPNDQVFNAIKKEALPGKGGGGGGIVPNNKKHCTGHFTGTPEQADRFLRRLHAGAWTAGKESGATLNGMKDLPRKEVRPTFRFLYEQTGRTGEVTAILERGEKGTTRGTFHFTITLVIVESEKS